MEIYDEQRQLRQSGGFSMASGIAVWFIGGRGRFLQSDATKPSDTGTVAPLLQPSCDEQIGESPLRADEFARRVSRLLMDVNHTPKVTHPLARRIFCVILEWRAREQV